MWTWGGRHIQRILPDVLFAIVLALSVAIPVAVHRLDPVASSSSSGSSGGGSSGSGSSGSGGTSSGGSSGSDGSSGGSGGAGGSGSPGDGQGSGPGRETADDQQDPDDSGGTSASFTSSGDDGGASADATGLDRGDKGRPEEVGDAFVAVVEDLPLWFPLYCLIGLFGDPADAPANVTDVPRDVARACSNVMIDGPTGDGGGSFTSTTTNVSIDRSTDLRIEVLPPAAGSRKNVYRVTPLPADPDDNDLFQTLVLIALFAIVVLLLALVVVLRRRRTT